LKVALNTINQTNQPESTNSLAKEGIKQHIMKIIIVFFYFQGLTYRETTSERQSTIINKEQNTKEDTG
jgi:hypothetical protein